MVNGGIIELKETVVKETVVEKLVAVDLLVKTVVLEVGDGAGGEAGRGGGGNGVEVSGSVVKVTCLNVRREVRHPEARASQRSGVIYSAGHLPLNQ